MEPLYDARQGGLLFFMNKPTAKTKEALDYNECTRFIEEKYKIVVRDYARKFASGCDDSQPYQDFWHWMIDTYPIHNGCFITMSSEDEWNVKEPWQKEILDLYLKEFGDPVELWVDW